MNGGVPIPAPISFFEIEAFRRTTLSDLSAADVALIRRLDQQFIRIASGVPDPSEQKASLVQMLRERAAADRAKR